MNDLSEYLNPGNLLFWIYKFFGGLVEWLNTSIEIPGIEDPVSMLSLVLGGSAVVFAAIVLLIIVKRVTPGI